MQEELFTWDDAFAKELYINIKPLAKYIANAYVEYLPKLVYPIRVGEHTNTVFGLSFAYDYAIALNDTVLQNSIETNATRFYLNDKACPINWEPSSYDFLSPCLQEVDLMRKILTNTDFEEWFASFLPQLHQQKLGLTPGKIIDRSDGKLEHLSFSLSKIADGDYAGQHWLGSFALFAFKCKIEAEID